MPMRDPDADPNADNTDVPAQDILAGLGFLPLPEGCSPMSAIVFVKAMDDEGDIQWFHRFCLVTSNDVIGTLTTALQMAILDSVSRFSPVDRDE